MSNIIQKQLLTDALNLNHLLTTPLHIATEWHKGKKTYLTSVDSSYKSTEI